MGGRGGVGLGVVGGGFSILLRRGLGRFTLTLPHPNPPPKGEGITSGRGRGLLRGRGQDFALGW